MDGRNAAEVALQGGSSSGQVVVDEGDVGLAVETVEGGNVFTLFGYDGKLMSLGELGFHVAEIGLVDVGHIASKEEGVVTGRNG